MKHTPGPWKVMVTPSGYRDEVIGPSSSLNKDGLVKRVASTREDSIDSWDELEANARLIAAAPEMLEALEEVYDRYGDDNPLMHRIANLVAKTKGEE